MPCAFGAALTGGSDFGTPAPACFGGGGPFTGGILGSAIIIGAFGGGGGSIAGFGIGAGGFAAGRASPQLELVRNCRSFRLRSFWLGSFRFRLPRRAALITAPAASPTLVLRRGPTMLALLPLLPVLPAGRRPAPVALLVLLATVPATTSLALPGRTRAACVSRPLPLLPSLVCRLLVTCAAAGGRGAAGGRAATAAALVLFLLLAPLLLFFLQLLFELLYLLFVFPRSFLFGTAAVSPCHGDSSRS